MSCIAVWVPDERHEAVRELTRARGAAAFELRAKCQQVSSMLLRLGRHYPGKTTWGKAHMAWLAGQKLEHLEQRIALEERLVAGAPGEGAHRTTGAGDRRGGAGLVAMARLATALMALRGVDFIAATTLLAEIGDLSRFLHAARADGLVSVWCRASSPPARTPDAARSPRRATGGHGSS